LFFPSQKGLSSFHGSRLSFLTINASRNKKFFYFQDILIEIAYLGGKDLRIAMILAGVLLILAPSAWAMGTAGSISLDVLGSDINDSSIFLSNGESVDVEILGSTSQGLRIGTEESEIDAGCEYSCSPYAYCGCGGNPFGCSQSGCSPCGPCYTTPWDDFNRPLCYPWSSYIPTMYNRNFCREQPTCTELPGVLTLGMAYSHAKG
jgi:hypothetical protein